MALPVLSPQDTEVLLFGFQSIAETIDVNYSDVIPGLIGLIPRINISNIMLADTVMYTIGTRPPELSPKVRELTFLWLVTLRPPLRISG